MITTTKSLLKICVLLSFFFVSNEGFPRRYHKYPKRPHKKPVTFSNDPYCPKFMFCMSFFSAVCSPDENIASYQKCPEGNICCPSVFFERSCCHRLTPVHNFGEAGTYNKKTTSSGLGALNTIKNDVVHVLAGKELMKYAEKSKNQIHEDHEKQTEGKIQSEISNVKELDQLTEISNPIENSRIDENQETIDSSILIKETSEVKATQKTDEQKIDGHMQDIQQVHVNEEKATQQPMEPTNDNRPTEQIHDANEKRTEAEAEVEKEIEEQEQEQNKEILVGEPEKLLIEVDDTDEDGDDETVVAKEVTTEQTDKEVTETDEHWEEVDETEKEDADRKKRNIGGKLSEDKIII